MNRIRKKYNRIFKESFIEYKLESFEISKEELSEKKAKIQDFINFINIQLFTVPLVYTYLTIDKTSY